MASHRRFCGGAVVDIQRRLPENPSLQHGSAGGVAVSLGHNTKGDGGAPRTRLVCWSVTEEFSSQRFERIIAFH